MKMDEKYLEEIRNQEKIMLELNSNSQSSDNVEKSIDTEPAAKMSEPIPPMPEPSVKPPTGQSTLFGGEQ